jgi:hypothetical protein
MHNPIKLTKWTSLNFLDSEGGVGVGEGEGAGAAEIAALPDVDLAGGSRETREGGGPRGDSEDVTAITDGLD